MFEPIEQIAVRADAVSKDGLRRVGWAELAAAISLSRDLRQEEGGLLALAGPSFDGPENKDERAVNLSSLASGKAPEHNGVLSANEPPRRHREKT